MEDELRHIRQAIEGLDQQLSCLTKDVGDLKREEEAILEQSSRRNIGVHPMHNDQWAYGNFSPFVRSYEYNFNDCYKKVPRNEVRNGGNYVKLDESYGSKNMYNEHNDSYSYRGYNYRRSSQTLGTTSRPLILMITKHGSKKWNHCSIPMV
ncbi:hypothetical protein M9H77_07574 [Catharanthus roseus]|uniref:Uncharacterized protein n=1 Tax=Catharanthus roseus TaxID=4058 RepID=A0ACC0BVB3_CATRO|nr:hypothetical protein M9H77_07574 [Catharanthus roseus]